MKEFIPPPLPKPQDTMSRRYSKQRNAKKNWVCYFDCCWICVPLVVRVKHTRHSVAWVHERPTLVTLDHHYLSTLVHRRSLTTEPHQRTDTPDTCRDATRGMSCLCSIDWVFMKTTEQLLCFRFAVSDLSGNSKTRVIQCAVLRTCAVATAAITWH
jgi:hypothetical protein